MEMTERPIRQLYFKYLTATFKAMLRTIRLEGFAPRYFTKATGGVHVAP